MKEHFETTYNRIGYLFYAVAFEQRKLSPYDFKKLKEVIDATWKAQVNSDACQQLKLMHTIYDSMDECYKGAVESNKAFKVFEEYYLMHNLNFGRSLREHILYTCNDIVRDFSHYSRNEKRSELLKELKKLIRHEEDLVHTY